MLDFIGNSSLETTYTLRYIFLFSKIADFISLSSLHVHFSPVLLSINFMLFTAYLCKLLKCCMEQETFKANNFLNHQIMIIS